MRIYAASDIHGCLSELDEALEEIDLDNPDSTLVLCGDYIDRGPDSFGVIRRLAQLEAEAAAEVRIPRGNHEDMLLKLVECSDDEAYAAQWLQTDRNLNTTASFLDEEEFREVRHLLLRRRIAEAFSLYTTVLKTRYAEVLEWIDRLPYYYETEKQIFVHAGIREDAVFEDGTVYWKLATSDLDYTTIEHSEYSGNKFVKDVVVGHTTTDRASGNRDYRGVWHDGASHFFIDGNVVANGELAVLCYDAETGLYSGPGLD